MAIETISILDAAGATKLVKADVIGTDYAQVLKVAYGTDGTLTLAETGAGLPVNIENASVTVNQSRPSTGTLTTVAAATSSTQLLASNVSRKDCTLYNDSASAVRIGLTAGTVSTSAFTILIAANEYYEIPYGYTGRIAAIWVTATGNMRITELT